ncbi:MAG TPA: TolC family protein [Vicinamibacteria bacterium]|nr:TolC family protein [Vicinamibacteria bacterium]
MKVTSVVLALGLGAALGAAPAASGEDVPVTLDEALALAAQANPELQAASARVDAQAARTESVRRTRWPRLGLQMAWSRTDLPAGVFANKLNSGAFAQADFAISSLNDPSALNHLGTNLSLEAPIDVFGKVGTMASAMAASGDAASAGTRDATQEIRLRVVEAYRQAEMAGRAADLMERVVGVAKAREGEIQARVDTGGALQADLLRARARRREREAELAERRGQRRMAQAGLARLLGAQAGVDYVPTEGPPPVSPLEGDEVAWVERALRQRPVLEAARRKTDAASAFVKNEKNALLPDFGVFGQLWDNRIQVDDGKQSWAVGASLRWTPFDPSRTKRTAAAAAEQRAAELEARAATDQVRLEVAMAYRRAVSARERHIAASGGSEEGREAFRVVQERRKAGLATLTDELETETAALGAMLQEIGAASEVAIADAALKRAAGEI